MNNDYKNILKNYINPSILLLPLLEKRISKWDYEILSQQRGVPIEFWNKHPDKIVRTYSTFSYSAREIELYGSETCYKPYFVISKFIKTAPKQLLKKMFE